jgi:hypothetical protein
MPIAIVKNRVHFSSFSSEYLPRGVLRRILAYHWGGKFRVEPLYLLDLGASKSP